MNDSEIVSLYWARDEAAISESDAKYGAYCRSIAWNILQIDEDADEIVNDTWLGAWNAMPPHRPSVLSTFLGKITRRLSLKRWRFKNARKRGGGETALALDELMDYQAELDRLTKEKKRLEGEVKRAAGKLSNEGFVSKAQAKVVEEEKAKKEMYEDMLAKVADRLAIVEAKLK